MNASVERTLIEAIVKAYERIGVPTDQLPYSEEFESLYQSVLPASGNSLQRDVCWRLLARARKRGLLPRLCR